MIKSVSIVVPMYNEEKNVTAFCDELEKIQQKLPKKVQIIFVDDGSTDRTKQLLQSRKMSYSKVILSFSRNFGHQAALLAGVRKSSNEYVITMDGDLQHPVSLIPTMLAQHELGFDIVLTSRIDDESITWFKKTSSSIFYWFINALSATAIPINSSDFRSMSRKALLTLLSLPEKQIFLRGMVAWLGFSSVVLPFAVAPRHAGTSKYSLTKMLSLAIKGITSFSVIPLYISAVFGCVFFSLSVMYALYVIYARFFTNTAVTGWASLLFVELVIGGCILLFLGLLGIYIAAIYQEVKGRPIYIIKDEHES